MLIDISHLSAESESRRNALLADAENYRLARLVRRARRLRTTPRSDPPQAEPPQPAPHGSGSAPRNDEAERRCVVSR